VKHVRPLDGEQLQLVRDPHRLGLRSA
jgi:hypothetical protein